MTAQSYVYKLYELQSAIGLTLTGIQCTTTQDPFIKTCASTIPMSFDSPGKVVDMTVTIAGIESPHSASTTVPQLIVPPTPPTNLRMFRYVGTIPAAPGGK
jgi:hypothetical protein